MAKTSINLQDSFLNQVRKDNLEIQLVLLDGSKLQGYVRGFDNFTVIVNGHDAQHLIYKHAIMQVITTRRISDGEHTPQHREPRRQGNPSHSQNPEQHRQGPGPGTGSAPGQGHVQNQSRRERDQTPRPPRESDKTAASKFNSLDLSSVKIEDQAESV